MTATTYIRNDAQETTSLLGRRRGGSVVTPRTPLPYVQLGILCLVRICDPLLFTFVFPMITQMMTDLHVGKTPSDNAFWGGLVSGLFALAQFTSAFYFGSLSDKIGRRPVLFLGMSSSMICVFFFGLSQSFTSVVILRAIAGVMLSNVAVIQSILGEITDSTNRASAIPITAITWALGCIIGPVIGSLHHPTTLMPGLFGGSQFLHDYPYFLPCFVISSIIAFSLIISFLFLKESLPIRVREQLVPEDKIADYEAIKVGPVKLPINSPSHCKLPYKMLCIASIPAIQAILVCSFILNVLSTGYDITFILMSSTPIASGGLSRSYAQTSTALGGGVLVSVFILPTLFAPLQHRLGSKRMYFYLMWMWPVTYLGLPLLNVVARVFSSPESQDGTLTMTGDIIMWLGIAILVAIPRLATMNLSLHILLLKDAAPSPTVLGSTFGLSQTVGSMARAISPAFASSIFALTVSNHFLGGQGVWLILSSIGFLGVYASTRLKDDQDTETSPQPAAAGTYNACTGVFEEV